MRVASLLPLVCSLLPAMEAPASGPSDRLCWKRDGFDSSGRVVWIDSIYYDAAGKPLLERRRDAQGGLESTVKYHYDTHGHEVRRERLTHAGEAIAATECMYQQVPEGLRMAMWSSHGDSARGMLWVGRNGWPSGDTTMNIFEGVIRFAQRRGRLARAGMQLDGARGTEASFAYDSLGRHVTTRFSRRGGLRLGRDSTAWDSAGRPREWTLRDSRGSVTRRETWKWSTEGNLLERQSFRDSGFLSGGIRYAWARRDSVPVVSGVRSRYPGAAQGRPCAFDWKEMVPFAIEPKSLEGLFLESGSAGRSRMGKYKPGPDPDGLFPDEPGIDDSCGFLEDESKIPACHDFTEARGKAEYFGPLANCMTTPAGPCADTLIAAIERLLDSIDRPEVPEEAIDSLAGILLLRGPPDAEKLLLGIIREGSQPADLWRVVLDALLKRRVDRGYSQFIAAGGTVPLPARMPPGIGRADTAVVGPRLAAAWEYRQRVLAVDPASPMPARGMRSEFDFEGSRRSVLAWMRTGDARDLRRAERQGAYFSGSEGLVDPDDALPWARLAEALEAGRLGAVLHRTEDPERVRQVLASRGLDWEAYLLGYLADPGSQRWRPSYQAFLARSGSIAAAEALITMPVPPHTGGEFEPGFAMILGALAAAPHPDSGTPPSYLPEQYGLQTPFRRNPADQPLPPRLRARALARMLEPLETDPYACPALEILAVLAEEDIPGRADYLVRAAAIPDSGVRDSALALLRRLHPARKLPEGLIPLDPIRFRLISGGRPLGKVALRVMGSGDAAAAKSIRRGGYFRTDAGGYFEIDRMVYMRLLRGTWDISLLSAGGRNVSNPVFRARIGATEWPAGTVTVEVPLRSVAIVPELPSGFIPAQESQARVRVEADHGGSADMRFSLPWRDTLVFPAWGEGVYRVELSLPGLRKQSLPPIRVTGKDVVARQSLRRGADVTVIVETPPELDVGRLVGVSVVTDDGREIPPTPIEGLIFDDSTAVAGQPILFAGLAPGAYILKVKTSRGLRAQLHAARLARQPILNRPIETGVAESKPSFPNHKGLEYSFQVPDEGPDDLDLGRLRTEADSPGEGLVVKPGSAKSGGVKFEGVPGPRNVGPRLPNSQ